METTHQRLMDIIKRLYAGERLKISALAKDYNVSTKTIQRDLKERLKSSSLTKEGHQFFLKTQGEQEDFLIDFLCNFSKSMGEEFFLKVCQIFSKYQAIKDDTSFLYLQAKSLTQKLDIILALQNAMKKSTQISLSLKGEQISNLQPYKISSINAQWYLFAKREEEMLFLCLEEIEKVRLLRKKFVFSKDSLRRFEAEFFKEPRTLISLLIYPEIAPLFKQKHFASHQKMIEDKDGNLIIEFLSNNLLGIEQEILKNLPYIAVLEPQELRERVEEKVLTYAKRIS